MTTITEPVFSFFCFINFRRPNTSPWTFGLSRNHPHFVFYIHLDFFYGEKESLDVWRGKGTSVFLKCGARSQRDHNADFNLRPATPRSADLKSSSSLRGIAEIQFRASKVTPRLAKVTPEAVALRQPTNCFAGARNIINSTQDVLGTCLRAPGSLPLHCNIVRSPTSRNMAKFDAISPRIAHSGSLIKF